MELPIPSYFMILSTLFIVAIFRSSMATATSNLMQDICQTSAKGPQKNVTYDDCINALNLDPQSATANLTDLARIALNLGKSNATEGENFIRNLISNQTDPSVIKPLKYCLSAYEWAKISFGSALVEIKDDPLLANYDVKIAGDDADKCGQELSELKTDIPSVTVRNNYLKLYSHIGDVITHRLYAIKH